MKNMSNPKNFKFELQGLMFQLPIRHLQRTDWQGNKITPQINVCHVAGASIIKQYVKKKYPNVVVSSSSSSFANGNSVDIYISDERGGEVDKSIITDVTAFGNLFRYGSFNGMIDMYEMKEGDDLKSDNGTTLHASCKYVHISNRPKFCSVPDIYRMLHDMTQTSNYVYGMISLEKAIENVKGYGATNTQVEKALNLMV
tara:strand:+ start:295 stop:891 length:597 start_codon:yes stop_codon:yes gene_type:complete